MKTRIVEKSRAGQTIRTETGPFDRETAVSGPGKKASYEMMGAGGMSDVSHSISGTSVKRPGSK